MVFFLPWLCPSTGLLSHTSVLCISNTASGIGWSDIDKTNNYDNDNNTKAKTNDIASFKVILVTSLARHDNDQYQR